MSIDTIKITGAKVHNLKNIDVSIPKNTLTVITGPSGSGKSSLAFDTIYVEGQRRYIESLSSYARQFIGQFQAPDVESITGLSPAIAIDQKSSSKNPRSTVGTVTEIYDYMRILFARVGTLYCPDSGIEIKKYTPQNILKFIKEFKEKTKIQILAPIEIGPKNTLKNKMSVIEGLGLPRVRVNGEVILLEELKDLKKVKTFEVVVDRILLKPGIDKRIIDSIELALKHGNGNIILYVDDSKDYFLSEKNISPKTKRIFPDLSPKLFSFNSPLGACPSCNGLGERRSFIIDLMVFDESLPLLEGAVTPLTKKNSFLRQMVISLAKEEKIDLKKPYKNLSEKFKDILFNGTDKKYTYSFTSENSNFEFQKVFPGILSWFERKYMESSSEKLRAGLEKYMNIVTCPSCKGLRLNEMALSTKIENLTIMDICTYSIENTYSFFDKLKFSGEKKIISEKVLKEIKSRLKFLLDVGLDYLTLNRAANGLSGGEAQRIRLATQIGSALSGVLYVLDEPSIGLHQRDNAKLIQTMKHLRDLGNTVIVVEHDEETMREADYIVDMGPMAGIHGGEVVETGPLSKVIKNTKSETCKFITGIDKIEIPKTRRELEHAIQLKGATKHNLKNLDATIPLGGIVGICGVSGSGKSTLIHEILVPAIQMNLKKEDPRYAKNFRSVTGVSHINSLIELDQSPIGRTPKSNPATYTSLFDEIRKLFSNNPESKARGYAPGRFSFNVKGGRCEECEGNGVKKIEMHFLADVYVTCGECNGKRYNEDTLSVFHKGKNISDILNMTIEEAFEFFKNHRKMKRILETLMGVGLGYMNLGQPATTLSGGEAQRLKLSKELSKMTKGHCLYILDEPTTGLHFKDIKILLIAINKLVELGNTVIVIEHNLDVIKVMDHIIEVGPEGGDKGGQIISTGTPEEIVKKNIGWTAKFLKPILKNG